jgi:hypothetical protein
VQSLALPEDGYLVAVVGREWRGAIDHKANAQWSFAAVGGRARVQKSWHV